MDKTANLLILFENMENSRSSESWACGSVLASPDVEKAFFLTGDATLSFRQGHAEHAATEQAPCMAKSVSTIFKLLTDQST